MAREKRPSGREKGEKEDLVLFSGGEENWFTGQAWKGKRSQGINHSSLHKGALGLCSRPRVVRKRMHSNGLSKKGKKGMGRKGKF